MVFNCEENAAEELSEQEEAFVDKTQGEKSGESGAEAGAVAGVDVGLDESCGCEDVFCLETREGAATTVDAHGTTKAANPGDVMIASSTASSDNSSMGVHKSCSLAGVTGEGGDGGGIDGKADVPNKYTALV